MLLCILKLSVIVISCKKLLVGCKEKGRSNNAIVINRFAIAERNLRGVVSVIAVSQEAL